MMIVELLLLLLLLLLLRCILQLLMFLLLFAILVHLSMKLSAGRVVVLPEEVCKQGEIRGVHEHRSVQIRVRLGTRAARRLDAVRDERHLKRERP